MLPLTKVSHFFRSYLIWLIAIVLDCVRSNSNSGFVAVLLVSLTLSNPASAQVRLAQLGSWGADTTSASRINFDAQSQSNSTSHNVNVRSEMSISDRITDPVRNVLLILSDDLKASVLGCYGDSICQTPNIDRLAKQGVVFDRAYCQAMWCAPSRQSFMHSRYRGKSDINLGSYLIRNGFYSARVGKIFHMRVPGDIIDGTNGEDVESCWTERFNCSGLEAHTPGEYACLNLNIFTTALEGRQSTRMPHRPYVTVQYEGDGSDQPDHKSADKAIEILRQRAIKPNEPFFLAVGFVRPHYPMVAPKQFFEPYPWDKMKVPVVPQDDHLDIPKLGMGQSLSSKIGFDQHPENKKGMWSGYYASVTFMDQQLGRILDELERLNLRESTMIIFTSDHGYHLGEHEFWQKSNLHEEVTRVPLIIAAAGVKPKRTSALAELVDLFPTIAEATGLSETKGLPDSVEGLSLVPIISGEQKAVRDAAVSLHKGIAIRTERYAYIRYNDSTEEFYDMQNDPQQFTNLAATKLTKDLETTIERHRLLADERSKKIGLDQMD